MNTPRPPSPTLLPPEQAADIDTLLDILIAIAQRILRDEGQCVLELPPSDRPYPLDIYALPVLYSMVSIPHCHIESEVMAVIEEGRITVHEAAAVLGLSVRQVRRLAKTRLNGKLEVQDVVQPAQEVLTVDRRAVLVLKAEREGLSANEDV